LRGAEHHYTEQRTIRTWGRRRLKLIEPLLPFATNHPAYKRLLKSVFDDNPWRRRPAPDSGSGRPPTGTARATLRKGHSHGSTRCFRSGGSPDATGGSPVLPENHFPKSRFDAVSYVQSTTAQMTIRRATALSSLQVPDRPPSVFARTPVGAAQCRLAAPRAPIPHAPRQSS